MVALQLTVQEANSVGWYHYINSCDSHILDTVRNLLSAIFAQAGIKMYHHVPHYAF